MLCKEEGVEIPFFSLVSMESHSYISYMCDIACLYVSDQPQLLESNLLIEELSNMLLSVSFKWPSL